MNDNDLEIARGSGNLFRDLGHACLNEAQLKALLAVEIIALLDGKTDRARSPYASGYRRRRLLRAFATVNLAHLRLSG